MYQPGEKERDQKKEIVLYLKRLKTAWTKCPYDVKNTLKTHALFKEAREQSCKTKGRKAFIFHHSSTFKYVPENKKKRKQHRS